AAPPRVHQPLDQQHMLACNRQFVAEKNLQHRSFALLALLVARLDKGADDGYIDRPHQVGHKQQAVFQNTQRDHGLAAIVVGNLPSQFADPFLNLVGRDHLAQPGIRRSIHSGSGASGLESEFVTLKQQLQRWHVTSCPHSLESKSLSQPPQAREKPPEPQTPASRRARSLPRPQPARAFSPLRSHAGHLADPSLSLAPPYAPARNDLPPASCGSGLPSACAPDPATARAPPPERHTHPPPELPCKCPVQEPPPRPAPPKRTHNPPLRRGREVPFPTKVPAVHVAVHFEDSAGEDTARPATPVSCPPILCLPTLAPAHAPPRSAE